MFGKLELRRRLRRLWREMKWQARVLPEKLPSAADVFATMFVLIILGYGVLLLLSQQGKTSRGRPGTVSPAVGHVIAELQVGSARYRLVALPEPARLAVGTPGRE